MLATKKKVKHQPIAPLVPLPRLSSKQPASEFSKDQEATKATPETDQPGVGQSPSNGDVDLQVQKKKVIKGGGKKLVVKGAGKKRPAEKVSKSEMPKPPSVSPPRLTNLSGPTTQTVSGDDK